MIGCSDVRAMAGGVQHRELTVGDVIANILANLHWGDDVIPALKPPT